MSIFKAAPVQEVLQKTKKIFIVLTLAYFWVSFVFRQLMNTGADQLSGKVIEYGENLKGYSILAITLIMFLGYTIESWYKDWRAAKNNAQEEDL
jgi:hypothetical protein